MSEQAGMTNIVYILAGTSAMISSTGAKILGVDNQSFSQLCDVLDITSFGDTFKKKMGGLKDTSFTISGNRYAGDTTGQDVLIPGNTVFIGGYPQGIAVASVQVECLVENYNVIVDVTGKETFTSSLVGIAAPVALPAQA